MGNFTTYIPTVRSLFEDYDQELSKYLVESNIYEAWVSHDNWNGGIDYYNIILTIPTELFKSLRRRGVIEQAETELGKCYSDAMRGEGESLQIASVVIRPTTSEVSQLGINYDDKMWRPGYFRLFISHLSDFKESASNLKECLLNYGIDGFVAHEDITPSKEWEKEIEAALFSLDALCAIVTPGFDRSRWCDQEVGIALGRKKMVFSIKKGKNPYGFFGKYQALPSQKNASDMAKEVLKAICTNEFTRGEYYTKLINLVLNASSEGMAIKYIQVIAEAEYLDKQYISLLHDNFTNNQIIMTGNVLDAINPLFIKYGMEELRIIHTLSSNDDDLELPF